MKLELITDQGSEINIEFKENREFEFEINNGDIVWFWLDRSQANLLMLYLQEHLK